MIMRRIYGSSSICPVFVSARETGSSKIDRMQIEILQNFELNRKRLKLTIILEAHLTGAFP